MIKKLKALFKAYKQERYQEIANNIRDPKTGISHVERERLLSFRGFTEGTADFFGKPFHFSHGPSFVHSVDELFEGEIYKFKSQTETPYIIDCGSNIGLSIYYFKKLYPESKIIAFEPDENIFNILQKNCQDLENVTLEKKAVWTEDTSLEFFSEGALAGSLVTDFGKKNNIITIEAVDLKKYLNRKIDFLKIDIEGAENTLVFDIAPHLHNVENLFLEYHGIKGREQNLGEILSLLSENGFAYYLQGASHDIPYPFISYSDAPFTQQLNISCFRRK